MLDNDSEELRSQTALCLSLSFSLHTPTHAHTHTHRADGAPRKLAELLHRTLFATHYSIVFVEYLQRLASNAVFHRQI